MSRFAYKDNMHCRKKLQFNMESEPGTKNLSLEAQEDLIKLFPHRSDNIQSSLNLLDKCYSKEKHETYMINFCFRCHKSQITEAYNRYRKKKVPELTQPPISKFYGNDSFVSLIDVASYLKGQKQAYSDVIILPVPSTLGSLLDHLFDIFGFIPHLERFLLFFPSYFEKKCEVEGSIFGGGKIDSKIAYFLALCGATELGCTYLMARYYWLYRKMGGQDKWIFDGSYPPKYKDLFKLNNIMARSVWQINESVISEILEQSDNYWSQDELAVCIEILAFSHQLSTIALGIGVNQEWPLEIHSNMFRQMLETVSKYQNHGDKELTNTESHQNVLSQIEKMELSTKKNESPKSKFIKVSSVEEEVESYMKVIGQQLAKQQLYRQIHKGLPKILSECRVIEKRRQHKYPVIDSSEYNFHFNAYPVLNSLTHQTADKLNALIDYGNSMARNKFGTKKEISTKQFRKAMVYYGENLLGYKHLDYDYKHINALLTIAMKFYIRLLAISPLHMTEQVIKQINHESGPTECFDLGHTAILIANMKLSLELTLTMRVFDVD